MQPKMKQAEKEKAINKIDKININIQASKHITQISNVQVYSPFPLYEGQRMFIQYVIQCLNKKINGLIQSPTGTGKTLSLLCSTLSWVYHQQQLGKQPPRIIYTSRTHAQLKQVVHELTKTGFDLKISILGSRDQTCINDDLKQLSGQSKQLECRLRVMRRNGLFCKYFHHEEYYSKMNSLGRIADIQEIKYVGKTQDFCPFFYQKHCKNKANLILMPYNYLLEQKTSTNQQLSMLIENSIIIFDEAHNIPNVCQSSKQFFISLSTLSRALQHVGELRQQKLEMQRKMNSKKVQIVQDDQKLIKSSLPELQLHASYICTIHAHMQSLHIPLDQGLVMNAHDFMQCLDNGTEDSQFGKIKNKIGELLLAASNISNDILLKPYWSLQAWFTFLNRLSEIYRLSSVEEKLGYFKVQICYSGSDIKINILCLDPKVGFQRLSNRKPHCIILTSGTLSPLNSIPMQLQVEFNKPLACPHIMSKQQVNGCIVTKGPNKIRLNFNFENRDNLELYKELGFVLIEIVSKTPNGVIVFVPSYSVLEKIKLQLTNSGTMTKLYTLKKVFFEKSNSSDFKVILQNYLQQASKNKGALLFALARGKISEGFDFSDEKCRAVVLVGVPYPAAKDLKVMLKMQYLQRKSKQTKSMNGNQWYICQTIRCINQSIGRIVRNKSDYGSIFLIDERFKKNQILSQISTWARQCLKVVEDFQQFKLNLQVFKQYFSKKSTENEEVQLFFTSHLGTKLTNKVNAGVRSVKTSISIPQSEYQNQIKKVDPEVEFKNLKAELKKQKGEQPKIKQGQSLQKLIFGGRSKKSLPPNTIRECPICRLERNLIKNTECIHEICQECWDIWLKKDLRCPICRVRVRQKYLIKP